MSGLKSPVSELPLMRWTANVDPRFREKSIRDVAAATVSLADRTLDYAVHPKHRAIRHRGVDDSSVKHKIDDVLDNVSDHGVRFVQVGAHNGKFDDPFHARIKTYGWHALLAEPQSDAFSALYERYKDNPNVSCANIAIGKEVGSLALYKALLPPRYSEMGSAIASTNRHQVRDEVMRNIGLIRGLATRIVREDVEALTLPLFLDANDFASPDFFACDTEGYDAEIVRQLFVEVGAEPEMVQWEHLHLDPATAHQTAREAEVRGYTLLTTHKDTFAYK